MYSKLVELYRAHRADSSGTKEAIDNTARELQEFLRDGTAKASDISLREAFQIFVVDKVNEQRGLDFNMNISDFAEIRQDIASSHFPTITGKLINSRLIEGYEQNTNLADMLSLFSQTESRNREETIAGFTPGDRAKHVEETMPYPEAQFGEKYVTIRNHKFGKTTSLTVEAVTFDQTSQILDNARDVGFWLGDVMEEFMAYRLMDTAWTEIDEATSQAYVVNGTRRAMFASDHSAWYGQTCDNLIQSGTGGAPSLSQAEAMYNLFPNMKDEKGNPVRVRPSVVYAHDLMRTKLERFYLLQVNDGDDASTGISGDVNNHRGKFRVVTSPFFPETASWFKGDPARQFRIQWVWRPKTVADPQGEPRRDILASFYSSAFLGIGATHHIYVARNHGS